MDKETCDYYEPRKKNYMDKICRYFTGDTKDKTSISRCRRNCSIMECKSVMGHDSYKRSKGGVIKQIK